MEKEKITTELIDKLSQMSQLSFSDEEKEVLVGEVSGIIDMLDQCGSIKVEASHRGRMCSIATLREDSIQESMDSEEVFRNAPMSSNGYFGVPKVVE